MIEVTKATFGDHIYISEFNKLRLCTGPRRGDSERNSWKADIVIVVTEPSRPDSGQFRSQRLGVQVHAARNVGVSQ